MWTSFDLSLTRDLQSLRQRVRLCQMTPTREWPLVYVEEHDTLFVVREWPDGSLTAYGVPAPGKTRV